MISPMRFKVSRSPAPVMLRQMGNRSAMNSSIDPPNSSSDALPISSLRSMGRASSHSRGTEVGVFAVAIGNDSGDRRPFDGERRVVPTRPSSYPLDVRNVHLVEHFGL